MAKLHNLAAADSRPCWQQIVALIVALSVTATAFLLIALTIYLRQKWMLDITVHPKDPETPSRGNGSTKSKSTEGKLAITHHTPHTWNIEEGDHMPETHERPQIHSTIPEESESEELDEIITVRDHHVTGAEHVPHPQPIPHPQPLQPVHHSQPIQQSQHVKHPEQVHHREHLQHSKRIQGPRPAPPRQYPSSLPVSWTRVTDAQVHGDDDLAKDIPAPASPSQGRAPLRGQTGTRGQVQKRGGKRPGASAASPAVSGVLPARSARPAWNSRREPPVAATPIRGARAPAVTKRPVTATTNRSSAAGSSPSQAPRVSDDLERAERVTYS
ncbi:hypothetical protein B0H67DRAFT_553747 [Lasiosphaeris hirsuta]|uniref:Uncharacterized protein n=1 Tax=Lasiosphaeris hirsuta TaxID=260670 RepID=A0AA40AG04_9PEZI|nr:hypothetical protein B0H67DRAFT_553747 [Lasiosphaeris hirsuta]